MKIIAIHLPLVAADCPPNYFRVGTSDVTEISTGKYEGLDTRYEHWFSVFIKGELKFSVNPDHIENIEWEKE